MRLQSVAASLCRALCASLRANDVYHRLRVGLPVSPSSDYAILVCEPCMISDATSGPPRPKEQRLRQKAIARIASDQHQRLISTCLNIQCLHVLVGAALAEVSVSVVGAVLLGARGKETTYVGYCGNGLREKD